MSHTPGPWTVVGDDTVYAFPPSTDPEAIAAGYANDALLIAECSVVEDAHLIAAAPDLLAALQSMEQEWGAPSAIFKAGAANRALAAARAAIAKATGGES